MPIYWFMWPIYWFMCQKHGSQCNSIESWRDL
jgi:hypothetical protein